MFLQGISGKLLPWLLTAVSSPPAAFLHLSETTAWSGGNEIHPRGQPFRFGAMGEVEVRLRCLCLGLWSKTCVEEAGVRKRIHLRLLVVTVAIWLWGSGAFHCSTASLPRVTCDAS